MGPWTRWSFRIVRATLWCLYKLLTLQGLYHFGRFFGTLEWCVNYKQRRLFGRRVERVLGDDSTAWRRLRATLGHFQLARCEKIYYLILDLLPREKVQAHFRITNREALDAAVARGQGVYLMMAHQAAQHVVGVCLTLMGYRVAGVRDRKEGTIRKFIQHKYEEKYPELNRVRIIFSDAYPRDIYRCFSQNFVLGSSLDVARTRGGHQRRVPVTVFGEQREFLTGTLHVALRCGATVFQVFFISEPGFHYRMDLIGPLVAPDRAVETPDLVAEVMQTYASNIEAYARRYPDHMTRV
jgi:KDO2-lipid IV(A) lauroyltransferase